jgi:pimeloyl-ACP methyl ester carboxylesterase
VDEVERIAFSTPTNETLSAIKTGDGPRLVLLHRSIGGDSCTELVAALASRFSVIAPSMPGFDDSERPDWVRSPRDLGGILLHVRDLMATGQPVVVGLGLGGWVAAEMATMCPERLRALVLVAPLGVQPRQGEITDPFLLSTDRYVEIGFADPEAYKRIFSEQEVGSEGWLRRERNREMTTRIAWKPRMFDQSLPFRLPQITTPTLILWGEKDAIMPRGGVERYRDAIQGAQLVTLPDLGHMLECEAPSLVADHIASFLGN